MRYHVLASDYDGTLAPHGTMSQATRDALERLRASGRRVLLVTGRRMDDLEQACPDLSVFDGIVAENGAVYVTPGGSRPRLLAPPPPQAFFDRLRARGVTPLDRGAVIVATTQPHELEVVEAIRALGLELQVIFNKGAVMVLPSGVNKASGLDLALTDMGLSRHEVVGVGDGENDHAFLAYCELGVAVADAVPSLAEAADVVTRGGAGDGVVELVNALLADDQAVLTPRRARHGIPLGLRDDATPFTIPSRDGTVLCVGQDPALLSGLVRDVMDRLREGRYQSCVIDPNGRQAGLPEAVAMGARDRAPSLDEVVAALAAPRRDVVVNLSALQAAERGAFAGQLLARLGELRARVGRPHFIVVEEADQLLAPDLARAPDALVVATSRPERLPRALLGAVSLALAAGPQAGENLRAAAQALSRPAPRARDVQLGAGEALAWTAGGADAWDTPFPLRLAAAHRTAVPTTPVT